MRINEIIVEQQIDELSLAGVGKGIGSAAGAIGRGVGNIKGAWQGAKDAYTQGRDQAARIAQRNVSRAGPARSAPSATSTAPSTAPSATSTAPSATSTAPSTAPATNAPSATSAAPSTAPSATSTAPSTAPATNAPSATSAAPSTAPGPSRVGVPQGKKAVDDAVGVIKTVRSDRRPQVVKYAQTQLSTIREHAGFQSKFLGIEI
jgi:hypothetical protein